MAFLISRLSYVFLFLSFSTQKTVNKLQSFPSKRLYKSVLLIKKENKIQPLK